MLGWHSFIVWRTSRANQFQFDGFWFFRNAVPSMRDCSINWRIMSRRKRQRKRTKQRESKSSADSSLNLRSSFATHNCCFFCDCSCTSTHVPCTRDRRRTPIDHPSNILFEFRACASLTQLLWTRIRVIGIIRGNLVHHQNSNNETEKLVIRLTEIHSITASSLSGQLPLRNVFSSSDGARISS